MILTCPNCGTQYVVKDGAIPPEGRQVRCAACKHSWHQDPELAVSREENFKQSPPEEQQDLASGTDQDVRDRIDEPAQDEDESLAEATLIEPRSGPEAEERAYEEALVDERAAEPLTEGVVEAPIEADAGDVVGQQGAAATGDWKEPPEAETTCWKSAAGTSKLMLSRCQSESVAFRCMKSWCWTMAPTLPDAPSCRKTSGLCA